MVCFYFLLSALACSGHTGKSSVAQQQQVATCQIYTNKQHNTKRVVSYIKAGTRLTAIKAVDGHAAYKFALRNYNNFIRVKLVAARSKCIPTRSALLVTRKLFIPAKAIEAPFLAVGA